MSGITSAPTTPRQGEPGGGGGGVGAVCVFRLSSFHFYELAYCSKVMQRCSRFLVWKTAEEAGVNCYFLRADFKVDSNRLSGWADICTAFKFSSKNSSSDLHLGCSLAALTPLLKHATEQSEYRRQNTSIHFCAAGENRLKFFWQLRPCSFSHSGPTFITFRSEIPFPAAAWSTLLVQSEDSQTD